MARTYKLGKYQPRNPVDDSVREVRSWSEGYRGGRLASLDAFRGLIMFVLAAHGFGIAHFAMLSADAPAWEVVDYDTWQFLGFHFRHAKWVTVHSQYGIAFWDLIQPAFMFMVGVAMPFSYARRSAFGDSSLRRAGHALIRAVVLVLLGVFLYSLGHSRTNWIFPNVLAQIGLGYFFVYLLLGQSWKVQAGAIAMILVGYWALFWMNPPPEDYDLAAYTSDDVGVLEGNMAPWSKNANVAFRFDQWLLPQLRSPESSADSTAEGEPLKDVTDSPTTADGGLLWNLFFSNPEEYRFNRGGYTTLNFVPSIATALLGVLCAQLLMSDRRPRSLLLMLFAIGALNVVLGLTAHVTVCPIVKRIWTPSWTLFSGGCVIWMLALFYLLFDVLPLRKLSWPLRVVGMNSLAVYLMGELLHGWVQDKVVRIHLSGLLETLFSAQTLQDDGFARIIYPTASILIIWLVCVWMYRNRLFVRV